MTRARFIRLVPLASLFLASVFISSPADAQVPTIGGKTIAHGYLTLSLLPRLSPQLLKVEKRKRGLNYGSNKVRFTNTVPAGARIRLKQTIKNVEDV